MKIDLYMKMIFTVIAISLVILSIRSLQEPPKVLAQQPSRVIIAGIDSQIPQLQHGIPVYIFGSNPQQPVSVNLSQLAGGASQTLPVTLVGTGPNALIPVKLAGAGQDGKSAVPVNVVQVANKTIDEAGLPVVSHK
jgi:hypothetical protein